MGIFQNLLMAAAEAEAAATTFEIAYSCKMETEDNDYINWSPDSAGDQQKWTLSLWLRRLSTSFSYFWAYAESGSSYYIYGIDDNAKIKMEHQIEGLDFDSSNAVMSGTSDWYHMCIAVDTTQSTETSRFRWYVDGTEITSWDASVYPSKDANISFINTTSPQQFADTTWTIGSNYYFADVNFIDGAQLAPTAFGETSGDDWIPIDPDVTYGTNGYRLEFKQTGTSQNADGLGADTSGNGNHFALVNLTGDNRSTITPTNNS